MSCSFLKEPDGNICCRRLMGCISLTFCMLCVLTDIQHPLLENIIWVGGGLIGLPTIDKVAKIRKE